MNDFTEELLKNINDNHIDSYLTIEEHQGKRLFVETDDEIEVVGAAVYLEGRNIGVEIVDEGVIVHKNTKNVEPYIEFYSIIYNLDDERISYLKDNVYDFMEHADDLGFTVTYIRALSALLKSFEDDTTLEEALIKAFAIHYDDIDLIHDIIEEIDGRPEKY